MIYMVTGCLGFIGSAFTRAALKDGHYVIGVDSRTYASNTAHLFEFNNFKTFRFAHNDVATLSDFTNVDYIVNFAAETHVDNSISDSIAFTHSNVMGVQNLLDLIRKKRQDERPHFIHISTDEVYGDATECGMPTEGAILRPSNPYAASKAAADMYITAYARTYGLKYNIIRPSNCWGKFQYHEKLIPKTIRYLRMGRQMPIHGDGQQFRSWLHVDDAVHAVNTVMKKGLPNTIYNIGGTRRTILEVVETVFKLVKLHTKLISKDDTVEQHVTFDNVRLGMDLSYAVDDTALRELGWYPLQVDFLRLMKELVLHELNQPLTF